MKEQLQEQMSELEKDKGVLQAKLQDLQNRMTQQREVREKPNYLLLMEGVHNYFQNECRGEFSFKIT